jgi:hypothetical protein
VINNSFLQNVGNVFYVMICCYDVTIWIYILVHFIGGSKKHFPNGWLWVLDLGR